MTVTVVFTCCGGAGGWAIARSLEGNASYRLVGVDSDPLAAGLYERGLAARYVVPRGEAPDYVDRMLDICTSEKARIVWPCSDEEVVALADARERFEDRGIQVMTASSQTIRRSIDKLAMVRRLAADGVPVPLSRRLDEDLSVFEGPVIVRPITGRGGQNVHFFDTAAGALALRESLGSDAAAWFMQERLSSRLGDMHLVAAIFDRDRRRVAFFMSRSIRTMYPWGGPALGGVPVRNARLRHLGLTALEASGPWYGPANIEFLYDPARQDFYFVEINPRYWGYSFLATAAGINFPDLALRMALGERLEPREDYCLDVVTMTSREQIAVPRAAIAAPLPGEDGVGA